MKHVSAWMKDWGLVWVPGKEEQTAGAFTEFQAMMFLECMRMHGRVVRKIDLWADALFTDYTAQGGVAI